MKTIDFIESDIGRTRPRRPVLGALSAALALAMIAMGLGLRRDLQGAFTWGNTLPPLLILVAAALFPWIYVSRATATQKRWALQGLLTLALGLSLLQPQTPASLLKFQEPGRFWPENFHCLTLGVLASACASVILTAGTFWWLPLPNRRWQLACAGVSGICGVAALTLHCMGPLLSHVVISHWGQIFIIFPFAYGLQRALFRWRLRHVWPKGPRLRKLGSLD
jgi:hypothetical protein